MKMEKIEEMKDVMNRTQKYIIKDPAKMKEFMEKLSIYGPEHPEFQKWLLEQIKIGIPEAKTGVYRVLDEETD